MQNSGSDYDVGYDSAYTGNRSNRGNVSKSTGSSTVNHKPGAIGENLTVIDNLYYGTEEIPRPAQKKYRSYKSSNHPTLVKKTENPYYEEENISIDQENALTSPDKLQESTLVKATENIYYDHDDNIEAKNSNDDYSKSLALSNVIKNVENPYYE